MKISPPLNDRALRSLVYNYFLEKFPHDQSQAYMKVVLSVVYNSIPGVQKSKNITQIIEKAAVAARKALTRTARK